MKEKLYTDLSVFFEIPKEELKNHEMTLRTIMEKSENAINSVDIMEGFAEVLQKNSIDDEIDIPVFTLEDSLESVVDSLLGQLNKQEVVV